MAKYKEIVSMVLDELKITSDDSLITEGHVIFLAGRYRSFLLKQRYYSDLKKQIPESNYQTLCIQLEKGMNVEGISCNGYHLRSKQEIPAMLPIGSTIVYPTDSIFSDNIAMVSSNRFRYVGEDKWMQNIIYGTWGPNNRLFLKSLNPQFLYLKCVTVKGIFENAEEASDLECDNQGNPETCDILDREFPLEDALIAPLIELVTRELSPSIAAPEDKDNNANDELSANK